MGKIVSWIEHYSVIVFFYIMILSAIALWLSLFLLIFVKSSILVTLVAVIIFIFSYSAMTTNSYVLLNKRSNEKICNYIESTNYSGFFSIISFLFYNSLLLQIYIMSYNTPLDKKDIWFISYFPVINALVYAKLINRFLKTNPHYSFSKLFSLYMRGGLIFFFIKEGKRI